MELPDLLAAHVPPCSLRAAINSLSSGHRPSSCQRDCQPLCVCVIHRDSLILLGSRGSDLFADAAEKKTSFPSLFQEENHLKCFGIVVRRRAFTC